jgi:ZIP family zinc transporter
VSFSQTSLLGALAGFTIFLSLPVARLTRLSTRIRVGLAMFAVGVLAFLFVDVLEHGFAIVEHAVEGYKGHHNGFGKVAGLSALLGLGFTAGLAGLGLMESRLRPPRRVPPLAGGATEALDPAVAQALAAQVDDSRRWALRTGMTIAAAIGVHNFAEGLAIGVSASTGEISLATVLIVGFALHNATEGFGIIGPLGNIRPSWRWLALAGLVGGCPTFVGAMVGYQLNSEPLELVFYAVAGGAILYVIGEVWQAMRRLGHREFGLLLLSLGFFAGIMTDLVVVYGGG